MLGLVESKRATPRHREVLLDLVGADRRTALSLSKRAVARRRPWEGEAGWKNAGSSEFLLHPIYLGQVLAIRTLNWVP